MNSEEIKKRIADSSQKLNMVGVQGLGNMQIILSVMGVLEYIYKEVEQYEEGQKIVKNNIPKK